MSATGDGMKNYVHARIGKEEIVILRELKKATGESESALVKKGLRLVYEEEVTGVRSALEVAGKSVGKFASPFTDLSTHHKHMEGYGK